MKHTQVLESRIYALKATRQALFEMGVDGDKYVIISYIERKRAGDRRFVILYLEAEGFMPLTVAIYIKKVEGEWQLIRPVKFVDLSPYGRYDLPYRRLAYAQFSCSPNEAIELINAFKRMFPSISSVSAHDVVRAVAQTEREYYEVHDTPPERRFSFGRHQRQMDALRSIEAEIEKASFGGQWPGSVTVEDLSSWARSWRLTLSPYVGDRHIIIQKGVVGRTHGQGNLIGITIDCLDRPSSTAMERVIRWMVRNPHTIELATWATGEPVSRDPWEDHKKEWADFFAQQTG